MATIFANKCSTCVQSEVCEKADFFNEVRRCKHYKMEGHIKYYLGKYGHGQKQTNKKED